MTNPAGEASPGAKKFVAWLLLILGGYGLYVGATREGGEAPANNAPRPSPTRASTTTPATVPANVSTTDPCKGLTPSDPSWNDLRCGEWKPPYVPGSTPTPAPAAYSLPANLRDVSYNIYKETGGAASSPSLGRLEVIECIALPEQDRPVPSPPARVRIYWNSNGVAYFDGAYDFNGEAASSRVRLRAADGSVLDGTFSPTRTQLSFYIIAGQTTHGPFQAYWQGLRREGGVRY
jgi:hypothetical protein